MFYTALLTPMYKVLIPPHINSYGLMERPCWIYSSLVVKGLTSVSSSLPLLINRIKNFLEKPEPHETESRLASPVFYCLRRSSLQFLSKFNNTVQDKRKRALGHFMVSFTGLSVLCTLNSLAVKQTREANRPLASLSHVHC